MTKIEKLDSPFVDELMGRTPKSSPEYQKALADLQAAGRRTIEAILALGRKWKAEDEAHN